MEVDELLKVAIERDASDLHLKAGNHPIIRVHGTLIPLTGFPRLTAKDTQELGDQLMADYQKVKLKEDFDIDLAYSLPGFGRFRGSIFQQRGSVAVALRIIPLEIKKIRELLLPEVLEKVALLQRGLVLVTGTTGSGKSTTLAAMIDHRNRHSSGHILTIEDPVEYLHPHQGCVVNQREIGTDTKSYAAALKSSLREAPDVILIGEVRTRETMEAAIELSGTGHLAISTLHANNAHQAMQRIINMFPQDQHKTLFLDLSLNMRAIISQRLVRSVGGSRTAAFEILVNTPHIADLIREGRVEELQDAMASTEEGGMITFDSALLKLYRQERISLEECLANADSAANLEAKIHFG